MKKKGIIWIGIIAAMVGIAAGCNGAPNSDETHGKELHDHEYRITETKAATCEASGYIKSECECGEEKTEILKALGHEYAEYKYNNDGSCERNGTETGKCVRCEKTETREKENSSTGHSFTQYVYNNDATCTKNGTETAKCDKCDETETRDKQNSKKSHETEQHAGKAATCLEDGWKEYETCKNCEYTTYEEIKSRGYHKYEGMICTECGVEDKEGKLKALIIEKGVVKGYGKEVSSEITKIEIPEGVEAIGEGAFTGYDKVTTISLPETLKAIENCAFEGCRSLAEIIIPRSVERLGELLFNNCEREMTVYYEGTADEWNAIEKDEDLWAYDNDIIMVFGKTA